MKQLVIPGLAAPRGNYIEALSVRKLFGEFSYSLDISEATGKRLGIISGANGTGKTTLLKLVHSALSTNPGAMKIATYHTAFEIFEIGLVNGLRLGFRRPEATSGPFTYYAALPGRDELIIEFETPKRREHLEVEDAEYVAKPEEEKTFASFREILVSYAPRPLYLPTERDAAYTPSALNAYSARPSRHENLKRSVDDFVSRLQVRARRESNDSEVAAYNVLDLSVRSALGETHRDYTREELLAMLTAQFERITRYAEVGLMSVFDPEPLMSTIANAPESALKGISAVVIPYLESQRARLDSLEETSDLIHQFTKSLNAFLRDKKVSMNLVKGGLSIQKNEAKLAPNALSSGERQLLLMTTKVCARQRSIVLIDEPELSLNSDWTRLFLRHLLEPKLTGATQFLFATHSIEIQAQYPESVLDLNNDQPQNA